MFRTLRVGLIVLCLFSGSAFAKPPPVIGDPAAGPVALTAAPFILVFRALNPRDYAAPGPMSGGLVGLAMAGVSNSLYGKASMRAAEAVRAGFPTLDIERELRAAFRCGEASSLCSEMVFVADSPNEPLDKALLAALQAHQWTDARLVSFWWYVDEPRLSAHLAYEQFQLRPDGKLEFGRGAALAGYYWTAPSAPAATKNASSARVPHAEEWDPGASAPRAAAILAGLKDLAPLMQFALSWNDNLALKDTTVNFREHILSRPQFRKVDEPGRLECTGLRQCNELVEGVVGERVWAWDIQRVGVYEIESRPRIAP